jgi:Flp pilus assembly protein TadD
MRTRRAALIGIVALCSIAASVAGPTGTVREVSGGTAVVETRGGSTVPGDKAEIYFILAGTEDEISVGSGIVTSVEGGRAKVRIENATGDVAKDHLVRFSAGARRTADAVEPTPPPNPLASPRRTLPPSAPSPSVTPKSKVGSDSQADLDPAAMELIRKGAAQHVAGNVDAALASYTSAIRVAPRFGVAYLNRANAYLYKPNFQAAITDANKAIELTVPKMADAYNIRGTAKAALGDYDGALADCNRVLKLEPNNALAYNNRANNKLRKADYRGALADCNKSISLNSKSALPYYNRGYARTNLGDQAGALVDWMKAVAMQPSFGAELNPKIAQLQALGITPKAGSTSTSSPAVTDASEGEWTDLVNPQQKLIGKWKGSRHVTQYFADGTFVTDPHLVPDAPKGRWQVQGDRLIENFPAAGVTTTHNILSIDSKTLVIRNERGETFRKFRISR